MLAASSVLIAAVGKKAKKVYLKVRCDTGNIVGLGRKYYTADISLTLSVLNFKRGCPR